MKEMEVNCRVCLRSTLALFDEMWLGCHGFSLSYFHCLCCIFSVHMQLRLMILSVSSRPSKARNNCAVSLEMQHGATHCTLLFTKCIHIAVRVVAACLSDLIENSWKTPLLWPLWVLLLAQSEWASVSKGLVQRFTRLSLAREVWLCSLVSNGK